MSTFSLEWVMFKCSCKIKNFNSLFFAMIIIFIMMHTSFSTFIDSFVSFDLYFLQVFGHLLGPRSFDSVKKPLVTDANVMGFIHLNVHSRLVMNLHLTFNLILVHSQLAFS